MKEREKKNKKRLQTQYSLNGYIHTSLYKELEGKRQIKIEREQNLGIIIIIISISIISIIYYYYYKKKSQI